MRVLHVTSDWKWTGSAAPMLTLLLAQRRRGDDVALACPSPPAGALTSLVRAARSLGVEPAAAITRGRRAALWRDAPDVRRLRRLIQRRRFDVVHTWHTRDHVLALRASSGLRRAGLTRIVRSWPRAEPVPGRAWNRWLFARGTDGLWCVSPGAAAGNSHLRPSGPVAGRLGAVDLARFRPREADAAVRSELGIPSGARVVGIVARIQAHRRFDLLLAAMQRLAALEPDVCLLVVGRGTRARQVAEEPTARLGLGDRVVFAGYRDADYAEVLSQIDVFTLLAPGTDGGCRALLEAAACGIPAVTSRRGALPEIVVDGETGLVTDEDADSLCRAWRLLLADPQRRAEMGAAARARAEREFSAVDLAEDVDRFYRSLYVE